jgi:nitrite reductase (NADH) large subunit
MTNKQRLVVIGNGMAGARLIEDIIARGGNDKFDFVMFGDEPYGNYNRILLSSVLAGTHKPHDIFINTLAWYEQNNVRLHAGVRVTKIDKETKRVIAAGDVVEPYDKLVIATGSSPFIPPMAGLVADAEIAADQSSRFKQGVFVFRTLDDCNAISHYAQNARRGVVIGGGLLGLEAARGLVNLGVETHVVHLMPHLMEVQLDKSAGAVLGRSMDELGVTIHLEKSTSGILGNGHVTGLQFKDGTTLDCDMVVISAGIRPNAQLAHDAGLKVERGIVVDDAMACEGATDIFAVGECAQHRGVVYGLVAPLWEQTAVLAERLSERNRSVTYEGSRISTKLKVMGIDLAVRARRKRVRRTMKSLVTSRQGAAFIRS